MSNIAPIRLRQVRDLGQVISDTFVFLRQNWKPLYKALAFGTLPLLVLGSFLMMRFVTDTMTRAMHDPMATPNVMGMLGSMFLGYLVIGVGLLMFVSIIQEYLRAYLDGEHHMLSTGDLLRRALGQVPTYLGLAIVAAVIVMALCLVFVLPGIWIAICLCLVNTCHGIERTGVFGSIGRSFQLVKGAWWSTFGILFLLGLLVGAIAYAVMIPFYAVMGLGMMSGMQPGGDPQEAANSMLGMMPLMMGVMSLVYFVLYPIPIVGAALQYFSQVEQKEQRGLGDRLPEFDKL